MGEIQKFAPERHGLSQKQCTVSLPGGTTRRGPCCWGAVRERSSLAWTTSWGVTLELGASECHLTAPLMEKSWRGKASSVLLSVPAVCLP